ncbi:MAG TPA: hypothetical protein VFN37_01925 [Candidatus Baltobacteraceae bacterium]|nr:hypothetical protein [Candidatus Baltobacteraceae bacterium]
MRRFFLTAVWDDVVNTFPVKMSCSTLGIIPVVIPGIEREPPGFAPRTLEH